MLAMELSNYLNILEHIRLALEVPDCARDRDVGSYYLELVPTFESTMSFDCEFEQVVRVALQLSLTVAVRFLGQVFFQFDALLIIAIVGIEGRDGAEPRNRSWQGALTKGRSRENSCNQQKKKSQRERFESHGNLVNTRMRKLYGVVLSWK